MIRSLLARLFLPLLVGLLLASGLAAQAPVPVDLNLGGEIRSGIRWLREGQNTTDGSYGGGV
ncbi:MAG: hypothetical protein ABI054_04815, partial [Planctomycetota bacterium]